MNVSLDGIPPEQLIRSEDFPDDDALEREITRVVWLYGRAYVHSSGNRLDQLFGPWEALKRAMGGDVNDGPENQDGQQVRGPLVRE